MLLLAVKERQLRDDTSEIFLALCVHLLTFAVIHRPTTSSRQPHSPLNPGFQLVPSDRPSCTFCPSAYAPLITLTNDPVVVTTIPSLSPRRANHTTKNASIGKDVVTAAVHESISTRRRVNSPTPCLTFGSSETTRSRCSTSFHHDRKNHLLSRKVPTTQRDEG